MKSVVLPNYNRNVLRALLSLKVEKTNRVILAQGHVLVKVHAAPVNPSDIAFIQGVYNVVKKVPCVPGFEGSGIVVDTSPELIHLKGKKVSFFVQDDRPGTWSSFVTVHVDSLFVLQDRMDLDQAACFAINPFTAYGLFSIALQRDAQAVVINAAGGQVPALIRSLAKEHQVEVINVVRKEETVDQLKASGCNHVLNEMDTDFVEKLTTLVHQLKATVTFDAVGGIQSGVLFNAMPADSELVVYGGLSNKPMADIQVMDLIFKDKLISGFNLAPWIDELGKEEMEHLSSLLQDRFINGLWNTTIQQTVSLEEVVSGLKRYLGNMSGGKVLIKPNEDDEI